MNKRNIKNQSRTDWSRVDKMKDRQIDYPEIPELNDAFFKNAKLFMPRHKKNATPCEQLIPNEETIAAMKEARHGKLESFNNIKDLMKNLKKKNGDK